MSRLWLLFVAIGLATYGIRLSFVLLFGSGGMPAWLQRILRFVPAAVFSAVILPELFLPAGQFNGSLLNPRLLAGAAAALIAWRTRSVAWTIIAGMVVLWAGQNLL